MLIESPIAASGASFRAHAEACAGGRDVELGDRAELVNDAGEHARQGIRRGGTVRADDVKGQT